MLRALIDRYLAFSLMAGALLTLSGCGQPSLPAAATPSVAPTTPPIATATPFPLTTAVSIPTALPIGGPSGVGVDCGTGEVTGADLAENIAVTGVSANLPDPPIDYIFTAQFGGVDSVQTPFYSALVLYDASEPLLDPPAKDWYFDNVGNVVYGFIFQPGQPANTFRAVVADNSWQESTATQFRAMVDTNRLVIRVPAFEIPPGSHWGLAISDGALVTCETVGIGADDLPTLDLPPLP